MIKVTENKVNLLDLVVLGMQETKAKDIVVMDLRGIKGAVSDYFVLCSASSDTQADAIADSVEEEVWKAAMQNPWKSEGRQNKEWILLDYVDIVAHIFKQDKREFYNLEKLWGDAQITIIENL